MRQLTLRPEQYCVTFTSKLLDGLYPFGFPAESLLEIPVRISFPRNHRHRHRQVNMKVPSFLLALAAAGSVAAQYSLTEAFITANQPFPDAFVSFSIEFSSFPDFAGKPL